MYPLRYEPGGVLRRAGHTEAAVDLADMAGKYPAGVLAEVMNDDGTVARLPDLEMFAKEHDLLIGHDRRSHRLPPEAGEARRAGRRGPDPHRHGEFRPSASGPWWTTANTSPW